MAHGFGSILNYFTVRICRGRGARFPGRVRPLASIAASPKPLFGNTPDSPLSLSSFCPSGCPHSPCTATAGGLIATGLGIDADGAVNITDTQTDADNIAIFTTTGDITYTDLDGFSITTVRSVAGMDTNAGTVTATATTGDITVVNTGAANDIEATGDITLTALADEPADAPADESAV